MSTDEEKMNDALDDLGLPGEGEQLPDESQGLEAGSVIADDAIDNPDDNPPGYISPEDWVDSGKSMDDWQGKNKYKEQYGLIQDNKGFRSEMRGMTDLLRQTVEATTAMQEDSYKKGQEEAQERLDTAIQNNDAQAAVEAQKDLNTAPPPRQAQPQINPVIDDFIAGVPSLDRSNSQFDQEFMAEFQQIYDGKLRASGIGQNEPVSDRRIQSYLKSALEGTKELFPEKFESPRNSRRTTQGKNKRTTEQTTSFKNMDITTRNPRDNSAYKDVYEAIKAKDPKAAEEFQKRMQA